MSRASEYAAAAKLDHPRSVNLREDDLLPRIDEWLAQVFDQEHIDETCAAMASAAEVGAAVGTGTAEATIRECDRKLARYRAALEAGTDPVLVATWIRQVGAERETAQASVMAAKHAAIEQVTTEDLRAAVEEIGGLVPLLKGSDPTLRARFYEEVGLAGTYDPKKRVVDVEARVLNGRVGGGT